MNLQTAAVTLLPTPTVNDSRNGRNATAGRNAENPTHHAGWTLSDVAHASRWGVYAAAIERWERTLGRPAPDPTQPSLRTGGPQLAPPFVEWMMGLPEGWVSQAENLAARQSGYRNARLSLLGDGVVPQQAEHAYRLCLGALTAERAA
jgi:DNA (cytosine-5)-methyltransferase 1